MADKSLIEWTDATWNSIRARLKEKIGTKAKGSLGWYCEHAAPSQERPAPAIPAPAPKAVAAKAVVAEKSPVRATGPRVISTGREQVTFAGQQIRVTPRAACLVGLLSKAKPNPIGDDFLISKLWNVRPPNAGEYLDALMHELGALKKIGLEVRTLRGIGRQIVEIAP